MAARGAVALPFVLALLASGAVARAAGPTLTARPTVTGTVRVGQRLTAESGTWTSAAPITYAYQWYRCDATGAHCSSVHGATAARYTLGRQDAGKSIGLSVTAKDSSGSTAGYASLVGPVATAKPLLVSTAQPQLTGLPVSGKDLQVTAGAWSPVPQSVGYSWLRCNANGRLCTPIAGATASSYTVVDADTGHALVALVQATFGTTTQGALSTASGVALGSDIIGPTHSAGPVVTGTAEQGSQLTGSAGIWSGIGQLAYAYQWYRCDGNGAHCSSIHGATSVTYRTVAADVGKTLGFTVHATDSTGTASAYASLFGPVAAHGAGVVSSVQPTLSGSQQAGSTLTVSVGTWQPPTVTYTYGYAWSRCNPNGRVCSPIAGATSSTYKVTADDSGHTLVAVVTATSGAAAQAAYSAASPPVA